MKQAIKKRWFKGLVVLCVLALAGVVWAEYDLSPGKMDSDGTIGGKRRVRQVKTKDLDITGYTRMAPVSVTYTDGTGFNVTATSDGTVLELTYDSYAKGDSDKCPVGPASSGVTVVLSTPTAAIDGRVFGIRNMSGTTAPVAYAGGLPIGTTSGTTRQQGEDVGDITWYQARYNSAVSYFVLAEFKND